MLLYSCHTSPVFTLRFNECVHFSHIISHQYLPSRDDGGHFVKLIDKVTKLFHPESWGNIHVIHPRFWHQWLKSLCGAFTCLCLVLNLVSIRGVCFRCHLTSFCGAKSHCGVLWWRVWNTPQSGPQSRPSGCRVRQVWVCRGNVQRCAGVRRPKCGSQRPRRPPGVPESDAAGVAVPQNQSGPAGGRYFLPARPGSESP